VNDDPVLFFLPDQVNNQMRQPMQNTATPIHRSPCVITSQNRSTEKATGQPEVVR